MKLISLKKLVVLQKFHNMNTTEIKKSQFDFPNSLGKRHLRRFKQKSLQLREFSKTI